MVRGDELVQVFSYPELPQDDRRFWLIVAPTVPVDLCSIEPGYDVDLIVTAQLRAMTSAWMGMSTFQQELDEHRIEFDGDPLLCATFTTWIGRSSLAAGA